MPNRTGRRRRAPDNGARLRATMKNLDVARQTSARSGTACVSLPPSCSEARRRCRGAVGLMLINQINFFGKMRRQVVSFEL
jgi:hypothetical protein